jgi:hypothetical protein
MPIAMRNKLRHGKKMIIEDRKPILIKRIAIGAAVVIVLLAIGFAGRLFFIKTDKTATPASETADFSNTISPNGTNGTEKKEGVQMSDFEIENKFKQELDGCINKFAGLDNMKTEEVEKLKVDIVSMNKMKARDYYVCQAVKNNDSKYCDALKDDGENYVFCQNEYTQVSGMKFPALKSNSCDQQIIDACRRSGSTDCEIICQGLFLGKIDECNKLKDGNPLKSACLAISQKDISLCSSLKNKDDQGICQEGFYFVRAARENNPSLLDSIENLAERSIIMLYFDKNYRCEKILNGFGENACNIKYNNDYLQAMKKSLGGSQGNNEKK